MRADFDEAMENNKFTSGYPGNEKLIQAKNVFFYRDGNEKRGYVKVAVHPNRHRSLDALLNELTQKMPDLSFGVRSIYTPKGHDRLASLNDLNSEENYVCSQSTHKAKGIDLSKIKKPLLNFKSSNQLRFNTAPLGLGETEVRIKKFEKKKEIQRLKAPASVPESETDQMYSIQHDLSHRYQKSFLPGLKKGQHKRILVRKNGNSDYQHVVLLNRRTARTFEQFMDELCGIFLMPVRRLYTIEGKEVQSLSAIFNGPNTFVAAGYERFRPMPSWTTETQAIEYHLLNGHGKPKSFIKPIANKGQWKVQIETLDTESDSGTTANVFLTIYGKNRATAALPLNASVNPNTSSRNGIPFQAGQIDEFEITAGNIGDIVKIRIHHDNSGDSPDWLVGSVQMENIDTLELLVFKFNRWFSRSKDNREIVRELPAIHEGGFILPVVKYRILIITGDCWNAGTDAKVFICLFGEHGDSGARQLLNPIFYSSKLFQKGQSDTFEIECVDLGKLKRLVIGHNGIGPGSGWFLDKIIIRAASLSSENKVPESEIVFPCNLWLDQGENDGKTTRELRPQDDFRHNAMEKEMWEYEKWKFHKGNIIIFYSRATGKCIQITNYGSVDALGNDKVIQSRFEVIVGDRCDVCSFKNLANTGRVITIKGTEITGGNGKGVSGIDSEFKIRVQPDRTIVLETVRYINHHIMVNTNDSSLYESRGPVSLPGKAFFIYCKGVFRDESIIWFSTSLIQTLAVTHNNSLIATGKRNKTAQFIIHKINDDQKCYMFESVVFPNQFIRIKNGRCDCKGSGEKDCLFKVEKYKEYGYVTLQSIENRGIYLGMTLDGEIKPTVDTGDKNVRFYPEVIKFGIKPKITQQENPLGIEIANSLIEASAEQFTTRQTLRQQSINTAEISEMAAEKDYYTEGDWKVFIHSAQTAERCEVFLYVYGEEGCSGPIILGKSGDKNELFLAGSMNEFKINMPIIGYLYKVRIELKPLEVGITPFWCLQQIVMENIVTEDRYIFPFNNRYFGRGYEDNELSREAAVISTDENIPLVKYKVWLVTGAELDSDCNVPISIGLYGEYGDSGDREFYSPFMDAESSFRRGMTDQMAIECVYLGELKRCKVTVHSNLPNTGWFCNKIMVEDPLTQTQVIFPANVWFDSGKGDKETCKFLDLQGYKQYNSENGDRISSNNSEETFSKSLKASESENDKWILSNSQNPEEIHKQENNEKFSTSNVNVWEIRYQAKELIDAITEQAANHVEKFHEMQLKQLENGHSERKK